MVFGEVGEVLGILLLEVLIWGGFRVYIFKVMGR